MVRWQLGNRTSASPECLSEADQAGVILNYNYRDNAVHNYWAWDHTHSLAWGTSRLVMDMYEHAYAIDYGENARGYIDAFFQNINGDDVNRRAEMPRRG
jgi:Fe-Mn family superoxide dismutase